MAGKIKDLLRTPEGRDSVLTYITEALSMLGMVLTFRLAAQLSKHDLDLYVIIRRTVSFVFPVVIMGAMVGLTRFVSMSRDPFQQRGYLRGALTWVLPLGLLIIAVAVIFAKPIAWTIFGTEAHADLIPPLGLMALGLGLHGTAYGFLRGKKSMVAANAVQLMVLAVGPCAAFFLFDDLVTVLWVTAIAWAVVPLLAVLPALFAPRGNKMRRERSELLRYGLPRVPGDIALGALLTVPGYVALRTYGLGLSGEVSFGATLLNLSAAVFSPVALLLLPAAAAQLAANDHAGLEKRIGRMTWVILAASVALMVGFEVVARPLLLIYLGPTGADYVPMSRIIFIGAMPFAFFNGMRSVLDAYFHTPRNGVNLTAAFMLLLVGSAIHLFVPTPWYTMGVVLVGAMFWLGWATWRDVRYVRSELLRLAARGEQDLSLLVVIPDTETGNTYTASRTQARSFAAQGAGVSIFHLESRTSARQLMRSRRQLKKRLEKLRPDVVHVHYGSVAALFTVLVSAVPVVITFMGDDLDRSTVRGIARPWMGGLFSQVAAFFAAGIICSDESVRDHLWWRQSEAVVLPLDGDGTTHARETLDYLREVAFHTNKEEAIDA